MFRSNLHRYAVGAFAAVLTCLSASTAKATLTGMNDLGVVGLDSGDGFNLTFDDNSGLKWLDLTITRGMSRDQVLASSLITGGNYRYATDVEVADLFQTNVGIALAPGSQITPNFAAPSIVATGTTMINWLGTTNTQVPVGTWGLVDAATTLSPWNTYAIRKSTLPSIQLVRINRNSFEASAGAFGFGSFLVQATPTTGVPEPSTAVLFGAAMMAALIGRRSRSTSTVANDGSRFGL